MTVLDSIRKLYPFRYSVVSDGNDASIPLPDYPVISAGALTSAMDL